ncbi:MAG: hypothetical protein ABFS46_21530, partial [Myxococcota bacterium]
MARPVFGRGVRKLKPGTAFFLRAPVDAGAVAIAAAHSVPRDVLVSADEVSFELGSSERVVSISSRLLAPPGRPFTQTAGSLREDFLLFALDLEPSHVRLLEADPALPDPGTRIQLLGIPSTGPHDQDDVFGTVSAAAESRIEVALDVPVDLRGWGGAPLLDASRGVVVGMLQAAFPREKGLSIAATPIGAVLEALSAPLEGGLGQRFGEFPAEDPRPATRSTVPAPPAPEPAVTARAAAPPPEPPAGSSQDVLSRLGRDLSSGRQAPEGGLVMEIEYPPNDAILGDSIGAFVAGRALA